MKKVFILFVTVLLFISCENSSVSGGRKLYKAYFNEILKDPNSFVVYEESYTQDEDYIVNWRLDYGAKNSLGGMVRKTVSFTTTPTSIYIEGSCYERKGNNVIKVY